MRPTILSLVLVVAACGGTADAPGAMCFGPEGTFEVGEVFTTSDGCVTYRCEADGLIPTDDNRTTVDGDLTIASQAEMDAQACLGAVQGALTINGTVTDFTPLGQLYDVDGALEISAVEASTMAGLAELREVGGSLVVADNDNLASLSFPPNLIVFGDAEIRNNNALMDLYGAEFIGNCSQCASVDGTPRDVSPSPDPARDQEPGGGLAENPGGIFYGSITVADNDLLGDVGALRFLRFAWADVIFRNNLALQNLQILTLEEVRGDLEVSGHPALPTSHATGLAERAAVAGTVTICGNLDGDAC